MAYRLTGRREDAEDLVQELLTKLYPRCHELETIERLRPWLLRVLYCQFIDNHRRHSRSPLSLASDLSDRTSEPLEYLTAPGNPEADADQAEQTGLLLVAIARLSEDHRIVLSLHDVEGYKLEEIQAVLDCPIGTLKSRLHRARARLRELLEEADQRKPDPQETAAEIVELREAEGNS